MAAPAEGMLAASGRGPPWARPYRGRGGECVLMETGSHPEVSGVFLGPEVSKPPSAQGKTDQTPSTTAWSQQRCKGSGRSKGTARGWEHPGAGPACQGRVTLPTSTPGQVQQKPSSGSGSKQISVQNIPMSHRHTAFGQEGLLPPLIIREAQEGGAEVRAEPSSWPRTVASATPVEEAGVPRRVWEGWLSSSVQSAGPGS